MRLWRPGCKIPCQILYLTPFLYLTSMSVVMEADPEDVLEVVRLPEDAIVTVVVLLDVVLIDAETKVEVANEADDSVQAVADSMGGATRSCGSRGRRRGCTSGARVPQKD